MEETNELDHPHTCPSIDDSIGRFATYLDRFELSEGEKIDIEKQFSEYAEEVRTANEELRKAAEEKIDNIYEEGKLYYDCLEQLNGTLSRVF